MLPEQQLANFGVRRGRCGGLWDEELFREHSGKQQQPIPGPDAGEESPLLSEEADGRSEFREYHVHVLELVHHQVQKG